MSFLVDTCGWIEYATEGPLAESFSPYFRDFSRLVVPTVVQYELFRWVSRERDEGTALELSGLTEHGSVLPLTTSVALLAADCASQFGLAMADAIIYATARQEGVMLATCDQHFAGLAGGAFSDRSAGGSSRILQNPAIGGRMPRPSPLLFSDHPQGVRESCLVFSPPLDASAAGAWSAGGKRM